MTTSATKRCRRCRKPRDLKRDFYRQISAKDGRQSYCKVCVAEVANGYYQGHRQRLLQERRDRRRRLQRRIVRYLRHHPCVDCGATDLSVLDFDHVRGHKTAGISVMVRAARPWRCIKHEIAKCEVRCANCHLLRTTSQLGWGDNKSRYVRARRRYVDLRKRRGCVDCGEDRLTVLQFDHVRGRKVAPISNLVTQMRPWPIIEQELAKCEVRCANCHRVSTWHRRKEDSNAAPSHHAL